MVGTVLQQAGGKKAVRSFQMGGRQSTTTYNREHGIALSPIPYRIVNDVVFVCRFILSRFFHVCNAFIRPSEVDLSKPFVEQHLGGKESEFEP